jgi:hypothetical protein
MIFSPLNFQQFPPAFTDDLRDYTYDASSLMAGLSDVIIAASVSVSPSGIGELSVYSVSSDGNGITAWLTGGVPNRVYTIKYTATTAAGRIFDWRARLPIYPLVSINGAALPLVNDFGAAVVWNNFNDIVTENDFMLMTEHGQPLDLSVTISPNAIIADLGLPIQMDGLDLVAA